MLLHCTAYQNGKKLADIAPEKIGNYLGKSHTFVWMALRDASAEELAQIQAIFNLHELAIEDAAHGRQRPKIEEYDDGLFGVMSLLEEKENPTKGGSGAGVGDGNGNGSDTQGVNAGEKEANKDKERRLQIGDIHIFAGTSYIVSIQDGFRQDIANVRARCEREPKSLARGPGYVFYALLDAVVDSYFPLIEKLETAIENMEERIFIRGGSLNSRNGIRRLYRLKRRAMQFKHAVTPLIEATAKLHSGRVPPLCENNRPYFRDVYDHLLRLNSALDGMRDAVTTAIQVNLALVTIDQTEVNKRLAAWAGIFAIATALAGIWGMNFEHMPELKWAFGYPAALGVIAAAAAALYWRFRRAGWL